MRVKLVATRKESITIGRKLTISLRIASRKKRDEANGVVKLAAASNIITVSDSFFEGFTVVND